MNQVSQAPLTSVEFEYARKRKSAISPKTSISVAEQAKRAAGDCEARLGMSKMEIILGKLRTSKGVTLEVLTQSTGWQAHSVRGFLSATVRKKLGLVLISEVGKDGARRYRIAKPSATDV